MDLSNNVLNQLEIGVFGRNNLIELNLSQNNFTSIPSKALSTVQKSLAILDLSINSIQNLQQNDFDGLINLTHLSLSHNRLESLEEEAFKELTRLKFLDLSNNPVTTWSPHIFMVCFFNPKIIIKTFLINSNLYFRLLV